jgi:hypothetical protein
LNLNSRTDFIDRLNLSFNLYLFHTMRRGVAVLSLSIYFLAALAALRQRPILAHGIGRPHQIELPPLRVDELSWFLPEVTPDDLISPYPTGSTKPVVAQ